MVSLAGLKAALQLFKMALRGVIRSPISFYDTTPMGMSCLSFLKNDFYDMVRFVGRILSRLSKDQDVMDNQLSFVVYQVCVLPSYSSILSC